MKDIVYFYTMRKIALIAFLFPMITWSQEFYVAPSVGFQWLLPDNMEPTRMVNDSIANNYVWTGLENTFNLKQGSVIGIGLGYQFDERVSFELGVSLWRSYRETQQVTLSNSSVERIQSGRLINIQPSLLYTLPKEKWQPYGKLGILITTGDLYYEQEYINYNDTLSPVKTASIHYTYDTGISYGVNLELGTEFKLNDRLRFFGGLQFMYQQFAPKKGSLTKYIVNDVDLIQGELTSASQIQYVNSDNTKLTTQNSVDEPEYRAIRNYAFNAIGIQFGVRYQFKNKVE